MAKPEKPINAIAISAAESRTIGIPRNGAGIELSSIVERMLASNTIANVYPNPVPTPETTLSIKLY